MYNCRICSEINTKKVVLRESTLIEFLHQLLCYIIDDAQQKAMLAMP